MVSPESGPQIQFTPEDASENPYQSVLARYEEVVGHRNPLPIAEAARIIARKTESPRTAVHTRLTFLIESLNLEDRQIPPDVFIYDLDRQAGKLEERFSWERGLSLTQAATVLCAITGADHQTNHQYIQMRIVGTYPSLEVAFYETRIAIPADFFLERFEEMLPEEERAATEEAIKKYGLSPTEYAVLILTARGKTNEEIAELTEKSDQTVKNHLHNLYTKLSERGGQVYDRTQAAILALQEGLFPASLAMRNPEAKQTTNIQALTPREQEVLQRVAQGMSNREVALDLAISPRTVSNHLTPIFQKLDCRDRTAAALIYHLNALQSQAQES